MFLIFISTISMLGNQTSSSDGTRASLGNTIKAAEGNVEVPVDPPLLTEEEVESEIHSILKKESSNTHSLLEKLIFQPKQKSRLRIPLCRMISLPIVRCSLQSDVRELASHFVQGYWEGRGVFYVSLEDKDGKMVDVTPATKESWSANWVLANDRFEEQLNADDDLKVFSGKMFMVWDGNHRLQAWLPIINREHAHDLDWHYAVESIVLVIKGEVASAIATLHHVNR